MSLVLALWNLSIRWYTLLGEIFSVLKLSCENLPILTTKLSDSRLLNNAAIQNHT